MGGQGQEEECDSPEALLQQLQRCQSASKPARKTVSSIRTDRERKPEEMQISGVAQLADYLRSFVFSFVFFPTSRRPSCHISHAPIPTELGAAASSGSAIGTVSYIAATEGHRCVLTGYVDMDHSECDPAPGPGGKRRGHRMHPVCRRSGSACAVVDGRRGGGRVR